jgi:sugar/nucleoside kinase (ribokinase family)
VHELDVVGLGNALVDVISPVVEGFLAAHGLDKGTMQLVDADRALALYDAMGPATEVSGGATANTLAGVASLGGSAAFVGRVRDDQLGQVFAHDIRAAGVAFTTAPATGGAPTGRSLIVVTPDAERTMSTFLGASVELAPSDVDEALCRRARVVLVEGYLWDAPSAREACLAAMAAGRAGGARVAVSVSDVGVADRHRPALLELIAGGQVDVLLANEREAMALWETADLAGAVAAVRGRCELAVLTRHDQGSVVVAGDDVHEVGIVPVAQVVDTTGAGDLYAAGFLRGLVLGLPPARCGELGALAAAEVVAHVGARPQADLSALAGPLLARS